jgi:hypothetical protein
MAAPEIAADAIDEPDPGDRRQGRRKPGEEFREAQGLEGNCVEPVEQRRLLDKGDEVEVGRHPILQHQHLP